MIGGSGAGGAKSAGFVLAPGHYELPVHHFTCMALLSLAVVSLGGCITNLVPVSAFIVAATPLFPWLLATSPPVAWQKPFILPTLVFMVFCLLNSVIYDPSSVFQFEFFRRDGNLFVSYAPLLILPFIGAGAVASRLMRVFTFLWTAATFALSITYFVTGDSPVRSLDEPDIAHFLFLAHNAAGGFVVEVAALSLGLWMSTRHPIWLACTAVDAVALWITQSRGSILALVAVFVMVKYLRPFWRSVAFLTALAATVAIAIAGYILVPAGIYFGPNLFHGGGGEINIGAFQPFIVGDVLNVVDRVMFLWPRAVYDFVASPFLGIGFGAFDDLPYHLVGWHGVFMWNRPVQFLHTDSHAHHSFLNFAAETGIVGLTLLAAMLTGWFRGIRRLPEAELRLGLELALWAAMLSALTEHRLVTPAEMLPFTILFGIALGSRSSSTDQRMHDRRRQPETAAQHILERAYPSRANPEEIHACADDSEFRD